MNATKFQIQEENDMKVKDLSNKIGAMTKGFVEIKKEGKNICQTTFKTLCNDQITMFEYLGMTVNFFNIETTEKGDIYMTIHVK